MSILETVLTCIFATMSAGGVVDLKKVGKKDTNLESEEDEIEFDEELYQVNLGENKFAEVDELDGIGVDEDENN